MSAESKKAASRATNYHGSATAPLDHNINNDTATQDDGEGDQANPTIVSGHTIEPGQSKKTILCSVEKVMPF